MAAIKITHAKNRPYAASKIEKPSYLSDPIKNRENHQIIYNRLNNMLKILNKVLFMLSNNLV